MGGTEDGPGAEAVVVVVHRADFEGNLCAGGLAAATAVKAPEEVRRWGYVRQGLLTRRRSLSAQALAQGLEGDLLALDLDRRQFGEGGSWGRQGESAARRIGMQGCSEDRAGVILFDRSGCSVGARLLLAGVDDSLRAVWNVDVDEVLRVEGVNLALTGSHDVWGKDGECTVWVRTTRPMGKESE
ncbi:hypothetical protein IEO21_10674 [Rhodonia placenta]|uniref:Uncharacterized protein n=1 Tax=Rhodonia placenta TaxID=104341 RepID=A0A8H7TX36_9APHY|nr:hypothetical protein IEO21_10674 [Postia placenta]